MYRTLFLSFVLVLASFSTLNFDFIDYSFTKNKTKPPFNQARDSVWVDSVFNSLNAEERIAQLLMYPAYSNKGKEHEDYISGLIKNHKIGGLIFMQGDPKSQAELINKYQSISKTPLLISMDAEWSLSMRLKNTVLYPRQMMLGAITDNNIIYEMGVEFARQLSRVGVHVSFSPCVDVNINSKNPVINDRSFGDDIHNVSIKGYHYMKGLQDNKIIATGKHFPGHGDTQVDSHKSLPSILHDIKRLDSVELYPFKHLINKGISAVMVSHLFVPAIDSAKNTPTSVSRKAINGLLKNQLNFDGLVFTDAMNMGGITKYYQKGEADALALAAGNDVILFPSDYNLAIKEIKKAIDEGQILQKDIDESCKRVLSAKYWVGLNNFKPIKTDSIIEDLNNTKAKLIQQKLIENAITLVTNEESIIPLNNLDSLKIASISFGNNATTKFQTRLNYYAQVDNFVFNKSNSTELKKKLSKYNLIILSVHNTSRSHSNNYGISKETIKFIDEISTENNVILDVFANAYSLDYFKNIDKCKAVIVSYNDWNITNDLSAQLIFGGIAAKGRLPISISNKFKYGAGFDTEKIRLKYSEIPEEAGVNSKLLYKIDSIMNTAIKSRAFPGGQIVAARNGIVFYQKAFGHHTYDKKEIVSDFDLYDLASVTKVISTAPALMKLYDEKKYNLDDPISNYLDFLKNSNKGDFVLKDILTHRAGFKSWIPFYRKTITNDSIRNIYYSNNYSDQYKKEVAKNLYISESFKDSIISDIKKSNNNTYGKYVYSDLGFYIFPELIKEISNTDFSDYIYNNFYKPIGAWSVCYLPLNQFDASKIAPTENDKLFRKQLLRGYVHDQGAAMLGGVSGHAGLFANANDVAKLMQMFLDNGKYGYQSFINPETVKLFTSYQYNPNINRRGLVWDKPNPKDRNKGFGSKSASNQAFGHGGFTGTMVWADPKYNMIYVFNSNRVYPEAENTKIIKMNIRTDIEEIIYQSIKNFNKTSIN